MKRQKNKKCINQILVTNSVIVTPDFKKKKTLYKFNFCLFCFLAVTLFSCCIYAEYDRSRSEHVSKDILLGIYEDQKEDNTTISVEEGVIVINALDKENEEDNITQSIVNLSDLTSDKSKQKITESIAPDGKSYYTESILKIPKLGIEYPVLSDTSDELLKISLNRFWGPDPNEVGNYVIVGHNYNNGKMFGKLPNIKIGDTCELTDLSGRTVTYRVYKMYVVDPNDVSCTSQLTNGKREITLITCTSTGKQRHIIKAEAI